MSGFIYYIACTETRRLKIGYTGGSPEKRLRALQTGSAADLVLIAVHPGSPDDEKRLHAEFHSQRLRGEWFEMSEELFKHVCWVTWTEAKKAIAAGETVDDWIKVGLKTMQDDIGPLPPELASLL